MQKFNSFYIILTAFFLVDFVNYVRSYSINLHAYNKYDDIVKFLNVTRTKNSTILKMEKIGNTYENRTIYLMKFSTDFTKNKPIIFIDANTHAREWVTHVVALNLINELTMTPWMLQMADWYIVPMVNPDGYEYSKTPGNRLWRKNRSKSSDSECVGVDLNRNYSVHWGEINAAFDRCNYDIYAGPEPFSEFETSAIRNVMLNNTDRIKIYITLHGYGQYLLHPYGYTGTDKPQNLRYLRKLGHRMAFAMYKATGNIYRTMAAGEWYEAAGGSDDFAYIMAKIPYVYTIEMTKDYGFEYPASKLWKVYLEMMQAFKVIYIHIANFKFFLNYDMYG